MQNDVYTLGVWRVKPGKQAEFIEVWKGLGRFFSCLPNPPARGTLIRSVDDESLFYSFGPWSSMDDIQAMRADPRTPAELGKLAALCDEARPGTFRLVATVD